MEELKEEIHKRDMQIIEERFSKGEKGSGWGAFARMMESDMGKELGKEALETVREIFKISISGEKDEEEEEKFDEYNSKALQPAREHAKEKEKPRKDFTPFKMMCKFIENDGDPSSYLEAMSVSYPRASILSDADHLRDP